MRQETEEPGPQGPAPTPARALEEAAGDAPVARAWWVPAVAALAGAGVLALAAGVLRFGLTLAQRSGAVPAAPGAAWAAGWGGLAGLGALALVLAGGWARRLRLRALASRRDRERRLQRQLRLGSDFTWEMDRRGRLTYLSPSFEEHTRHSVAEFLRVAQPAGPLVVRDAQWARLHADLKARRPYRDRVIHFVAPDGRDLFIRSSGEPVFDAAGSFRGWWGVGRDATAVVEARRELQRSQAMLDRLFRLSPDAICVASLRDGRLLLANPAFLQLAGLAEDEVMGRNGIELGFWRDEQLMRHFGRAIVARGRVRDFACAAWSRDGRRHELLLTAGAFDWDGEAVAVVTTRDVTETERTRREGDAILDNAVVGVCLVRGGRLERVNPQLERMLGLAPGALAGAPAERLFAQAQDVRCAAGETIDIERRATRPDGRALLIRMRGRAVDPRQAESGTIWIVEDITERRRAETELAQAKGEAEAASLAKSRFLATMSHEIRTPLSGVLGLARLLQEPALAPARRAAWLGHLVDAAELLNGIVSDVLDLSKIEAGHLQVERIAYDLHAVVWSAFRTFSPVGQERGLEMSCHVAPDVPREVLGDPVRVRQILSNYLSNALKFTDRGRIAVRLTRKPDGVARIEVRDSGIGVDAALHATLFQPFTQADSSTTRRFGGSGLGLSICRQLATLMDGQVGLDSDGRNGSCAWLELPLESAGPDDFNAMSGPLERAPLPPQPLLGLRVLLAEDNPVNRLIVGAMLARLGADVLEAANGGEAIHAALRPGAPVHAVLMDLHMPEVDGLEATRRLRAEPATADLPIIALTAAVLEAERAQAVAAGMNGFVAKPAGEADLLRALRAFVPAQA